MLLVDICSDASFILRIVVKIVKVMQLLIPILLIVLVTFDLVKVLTGTADDKEKKEAGDKIVKRIIYAAIIFLVPVIVNLIMKKIDPLTQNDSKYTTTTSTSWVSCWNKYYNE